MKHRYVVPLLALSLTACGAADNPATEAAEPASADACLADSRYMDATEDYTGMTEAEALQRADAKAGGRVVERDGECLGRTLDLRDGRANLVVVDGMVVAGKIERMSR